MDRQQWREQEKEDIKRQLSYWKDGANIERFDFNELIETVRLRIWRRIPCNDVYELLVRRRDVNCYLEYLLSYLSIQLEWVVRVKERNLPPSMYRVDLRVGHE